MSKISPIIREPGLATKKHQNCDNLTLASNELADSNNNVNPLHEHKYAAKLKSVKIGGGGFVTAIVIHPHAPEIIYARTDVGGLFRWDNLNQKWQQLLSMASVGQKVSLSVASVALDPNNPQVVYAATGAETHNEHEVISGNVLKSIDGGNTWQVLDLSLPIGGNEKWRWGGERLAVDPHNSNVVYFASRLDGLWKSSDGGRSWSQIDPLEVPVGKTWGKSKGAAGITFIEFDESFQGTAYVGVAGEGIYQTIDGGKTWQSLAGLPKDLIPQQGEINGVGELIVTLDDSLNKSSGGGVWKFNGSVWQDVTPQKGQNYGGLAVSTGDRQILFTVTYPMTPQSIYRSTDGGDTWTALNNQQQGLPWYPKWNFWTLSGDLAVSPDNPSQLWLTNGFGVWKTENALGNKSHWSIQVDGMEETVTFDAVSTPGGASLISAIADIDGFRHSDTKAVPLHSHSKGEFSTTTSISYSSSNPNFLVRASSNHHNYVQHSGFSWDNGVTWRKFTSIKNETHPNDLSFGNIAVAAKDTSNIVWQGSNWAVPYYTRDGGQSWNRISFFDKFGGGAHTHLWNRQQALAADTVTDGTFYIYHHVGGQLLRSRDGGESWTVANQASTLPAGVWAGANVKATPGKPGDVWVSLIEHGLYHSRDGGQTFTRIEGVEIANVFGFGQAAETSNPTLFVEGKINNELGVFGSTDFGKTWSLRSQVSTNYLGSYTSLAGDMNNYGIVYLGTEGNGFFEINFNSISGKSQVMSNKYSN
ncbi:MAG: hypothetical protein AAFQ80_10850 [Cyanobacteria bacterium J06621_8]